MPGAQVAIDDEVVAWAPAKELLSTPKPAETNNRGNGYPSTPIRNGIQLAAQENSSPLKSIASLANAGQGVFPRCIVF